MNKKYVVVSILIGCIVGSIFVYFFRRTEDNRASDVHYKTVLHNTAQPAEKTAPVQEDDSRTVRECVKGGYSLSRKRVSPLNPREKGRGAFPLAPTHWQFQS